MAKHTHGPLHVEHDDEALATYVTGPDGMTTACLSWTLVGGPSKEEQCANGMLYAAAPDLLEACKLVGPACDSLMAEVVKHGVTDWGMVNEMLCAIDAAIAEAEGK